MGGKVSFYRYSHTFEELVPPEKWFDSHPEYFSLVNGKRRREHSQLCLTNPDVLEICIEGVRRWMREHPECRIFSVAQNDWYGYCECEHCQAIDRREESHAGALLAFVNAVADAVRDEFPDNRIHTFAYLYSRKAPRFLRPRENVIVRAVQHRVLPEPSHGRLPSGHRRYRCGKQRRRRLCPVRAGVYG